MPQVHGLCNGEKLYWGFGAWLLEPASAENMTPLEAERRVRIVNANNRFVDPEDRVEARVVESA